MDLQLRCDCGAVQGMAMNTIRPGSQRAVCMCDDCQAYAHALGQAAKILDQNGGTEIWPMTPASLRITQGQNQIKGLRLSETGMYRWYADCCKTPIANIMASHRVPFHGVVHTFMPMPYGQSRSEILGSRVELMQAKHGIPPLPPGSSKNVSPRMLFNTLKFMAAAMIKGESRPSPFRDKNSNEILFPVQILTAAERDRLRPLCGPSPKV